MTGTHALNGLLARIDGEVFVFPDGHTQDIKCQHDALLSPGSNWLTWLPLMLENQWMRHTWEAAVGRNVINFNSYLIVIMHSTSVFSLPLLQRLFTDKTSSTSASQFFNQNKFISFSTSIYHSLILMNMLGWHHNAIYTLRNYERTAVVLQAELCEGTERHQLCSALKRVPGRCLRCVRHVDPAEMKTVQRAIPFSQSRFAFH